MVEKENEWILPSNLNKQQLREGKKPLPNKINDLSFFQIYKFLRKSNDFSIVKSQGVYTDEQASEYCRTIKINLEKINIRLKGQILDVGCGIGIISSHFQKLGMVSYGIDISSDAIEFASKNYTNCNFVCTNGDNLVFFQKNVFNFINVKEFHPFTQTNDLNFITIHFKEFYRVLDRNGIICICTYNTGDYGLFKVLDDLKPKLESIGLKLIIEKKLIPVKISFFLKGFEYNFLIYSIINFIMKILKLRQRTLYIIKKI